MPRPPAKIYQIKVSLDDTHPPIWRRFLVPDNISLLKLHDILQIVMGWTDSHLHMFTIDDSYFGNPEDDEFGDLGEQDEKKYKLGEVFRRTGQRFSYEYDFGDSWHHTLAVEEILTPKEGEYYPVCIKGKRACPPEDVGGVWGYEEFLEELRNPQNAEPGDEPDWFGGEFDPEDFDLDEVNSRLRQMGRGRSAERDNPWYVDEAWLSEREQDFNSSWAERLPSEQRAIAEELPLRRDTVTLLTFLRDHKVTGTQSTGNFPLKVVQEICARFIHPPSLEYDLGDRVYRVRSEADVWPLYRVHGLASVGRLADGGPGRRWVLTPRGESFLEATAAQQVSYLLWTWWHNVNWLIATHIGYAGDYLMPLIKEQTLPHLLKLATEPRIAFELFAKELIQTTGVEIPPESQDFAFNPLRYMIESAVINPLADFGILEREYTPNPVLGGEYKDLAAFRITPIGRGLLEAMQEE